MIDTQLFHGVILALAVIVGLAFAFSAAMLVAHFLAKPGQVPPAPPPRGGNRRDLPEDPQPEPEEVREPRTALTEGTVRPGSHQAQRLRWGAGSGRLEA